MTKIIEKLNRRDLVNIIPNGRTKQIYLSDKGKDLADGEGRDGAAEKPAVIFLEECDGGREKTIKRQGNRGCRVGV